MCRTETKGMKMTRNQLEMAGIRDGINQLFKKGSIKSTDEPGPRTGERWIAESVSRGESERLNKPMVILNKLMDGRQRFSFTAVIDSACCAADSLIFEIGVCDKDFEGFWHRLGATTKEYTAPGFARGFAEAARDAWRQHLTDHS